MAFGSIWKFGADNSEFKQAVREMPSEMDKSARQIEQRTKQMTGNMSGAMKELGRVLVGGALLGGLKAMMNDFDRVGKLATRFGESSEDIQRVGVAARTAGTDIEAVATAMTRLGIEASKAAREGGPALEKFERAGLDAAALAAASLSEKIKMLAEAQQNAQGNQQKLNDILEVTGVRAANINFAALARDMGDVAVASDETVRAIEQANDRMIKFGNSIKVAAANALQLFTNLSERVGDVLGGGVGRTGAEIDEVIERQNAEGRLRSRGELLPDDSTTRTKQQFVGGPVPVTVQETVPGPNAEENVRRVNAEIEKMRAELAEAAKATAGITDEMDEQVSKAEKRKQQQQELADLALQIKEAQAAGNDALADDLREYEKLVRAAIKYEGDLEKAARDVNAEHRERLRLQDAALQKSIAQVEKEVELAETMAFGTEEAKKKAEWMKVYDEILTKTGRDDLARRAANTEVFDGTTRNTAPTVVGGSGGGGSNNKPPIDPLAAGRIGQMQGRYDERINDLMGRGHFGTAGRLAERRDERVRDRENFQRGEDFAGDRFGGNNFGESFRNYLDDLAKEGIFSDGITREEFEEWAKSQAKTDEERKKEEEAGQAPGGGKGGGSDIINDIYNLLKQHLPEIDEKLPQHALVPG
jgi:hypothetical protein